MLWLWIALCLMWPGASSFMIYNAAESLCLQDSLKDARVALGRCSVDSELQQWLWMETCILMNVGTQRCLSAHHDDPIQTVKCDGGDHLDWNCLNHRLISVNRSLELGTEGGKLVLTDSRKNNKWRSLDEGDICQDKLRSRRQSEPSDYEFSEADEHHMGHTMTEEQREYLRWYYRTEDSSSWVFAMLAMSFIALLLGCMLLVMSTMGNRNRRKIAKYKAAAAATSTAAAASNSAKCEMEELQVITHLNEDKNSYMGPTQDGHLDDNKEPSGGANETEVLQPGEIVVTWKDGNISNLYSDAPEDGEEKTHE